MAKNNRQNHDFAIAYFIAGKCHTPDGAYAELCDAKENRELALYSSKKGVDAMSDRDDIEAEVFRRVVAAAHAELAFIEKCIDAVQPHRRYKDLPDAEAHEAMQQEEWRLELIHRAENYLITTGTIPEDHFSVMRMHPNFKESIIPAITLMSEKLMDVNPSNRFALTMISKFNLPALMNAASRE